MSYQAAREELALVVVAGVKVYADYASAKSPGLVIGLPRRIQSSTHGLDSLEIPLELLIAGGDKSAVEGRLLELAKLVKATYHGLQGTAFAVCRWIETVDFRTEALGQGQALACSVVVECLIPS